MAEQIIHNMDCLDYMRSIPDKYFDLLIADPPYGLKEHGGRNRSGFVRQKNGERLYVKDGGYKKGDWDNDTPGPEYFEEMFRVSKHQIIWGANYFSLPAGGLWCGIRSTTEQTNRTVRLPFALSQKELTYSGICGVG